MDEFGNTYDSELMLDPKVRRRRHKMYFVGFVLAVIGLTYVFYPRDTNYYLYTGDQLIATFHADGGRDNFVSKFNCEGWRDMYHEHQLKENDYNWRNVEFVECRASKK